jgi:hypothetical protein
VRIEVWTLARRLDIRLVAEGRAMIRQLGTVVTVATALVLAAPAHGSGIDPLRCEAVAMRKDGQRYDCLGRCERRHAWRGDGNGGAADAPLAQCRLDCEDRYVDAMEQLDGRDICSASTPEPDPNRCQSRLLRIGASRLVCKSQCGARNGSSAGCAASCDEQCAKAIDRVMAKDFCSGHGAVDDLCLDHLGAP